MFFEHEVAVYNTVYGIENEQEWTPGDRRSHVEINKEVPGSGGHPDVNEKEKRSDNENYGRDHNSYFAKGFELFQTKSIGQGRKNKRTCT